MIQYLHDLASNTPAALARLALFSVFVWLFWVVQNWLTPFDDDRELFEKNNWAYLIQRLSLVVAFVIACLPSITASSGDKWLRLVGQAYEHLWVFIALLVYRVVLDKVVLPKVNNLQELLDGNIALGIVEAGFYICVGFILNGSLTGSSPSFWTGVASTVVFGTLGLVVSVGVFFFHELVTPWNLRQNVYDDKVAAALEVAGILVAVGIVIREGVAGNFTSWGEGFIAFFATVLFALVMLYLYRWVIDKFILTTCTVSTIQANNLVVAAAMESGMFVGVAFVIAALVRTQL